MLKSRTILLVSAGLVFGVTGASAVGAVHFTSGQSSGFGPLSTGSYSELPGGGFGASSSSEDGELQFSINGDLRLEFEPGQPGLVSRRAQYLGVRTFEVSGIFPVEMVISRDVNFKAVNAGGPEDIQFGNTVGIAGFGIYETGSHVAGDLSLDGLGRLVGDMAAANDSLYRNGYTIIDRVGAGDDTYVLAPGVSYTAVWAFTMQTTDSLLTPDETSAAAYFEAGGVSTFRGVNFSLTAVPVPAPGAGLLIGLGVMSGSRCRRTR